MAFGTEDQKRRYLPGILSGDVNFAIGYTEPEAGTDLASLRTRAVRDGEEWRINGNKVFTSGANQADFIWLACRTDPDAPKHKGISIIIVPTDVPGFKCTPIVTVGSVVTQASYYDDVRVPAGNVVGDVNAGWRLITNQLNHERVGLAALGGLTHRLYDDVVEWCRTTDSGEEPGRTMLEVPVGAARPGPGPRPPRGDEAHQLAHGRRGRRTTPSPRPTRRRRRSTGSRPRSRSTACSSASSAPAATSAKAPPARCSTARSSARRAPRRSTPSGAASSRCCARSSPPPASAWPARPAEPPTDSC